MSNPKTLDNGTLKNLMNGKAEIKRLPSIAEPIDPAQAQPTQVQDDKPKQKPKQKPNVTIVKEYLSEKYKFRKNVISGYTEFQKNGETWKNIDKRTKNSIYIEMLDDGYRVNFDLLKTLLESDFAELYNPFNDYFDNLPEWNGEDYISNFITLLPIIKNQKELAYQLIKKWFLGVVSTATARSPNQTALILIGAQGSRKTRFFRALLPQALQAYYTEAYLDVKSERAEKMLTKNFFIVMDELATMQKQEIDILKSLIQRVDVAARPLFQDETVQLPRVASFCGTVNNSAFLNDLTGSRRFLCFELQTEIAEISLDYIKKNLDQMYSQALQLVKTGTSFHLTSEEIALVNAHNEKYAVNSLEQELLLKHFAPAEKSKGRNMTFGDIRSFLEGQTKNRIVTTKLSQALKKNGFIEHSSRLNGKPVYSYSVFQSLQGFTLEEDFEGQ
jgi:predicted P-loop ATPase